MTPPPTESKALANANALQRVRWLTYVLDNAIPIPGTRHRIGLDPVLGIIPGGGDTVGIVFSAYIILEALRFKLPKETLIQMVSNLALDGLFGMVPFLGDLFDVTFRANSRNLALLEAHIQQPQPQRAADRWFVWLMLLLVVGIVVAFAAGVVFLISQLLQVFRPPVG